MIALDLIIIVTAAQPKPTFVKEQADAQLQDHIKMQEDFGAMQDQMDAINMVCF